jgi:hypothetical protein
VYPGNAQKFHGKMKQKVEVNLTKKSVDNEKLGIPEGGFDRFGGNQVIAVICTTNMGPFSCLQIMNISMRETAEREVIVQLEWIYRYERLFWCSMSKEAGRPLLEHPQRRRRRRMTSRWRLRRGNKILDVKGRIHISMFFCRRARRKRSILRIIPSL